MKKARKQTAARTKKTRPTRMTRPQKVELAKSVKRSFHVHQTEEKIFTEVARRTGFSVNRAMAFLARVGWAALTQDMGPLTQMQAQWKAQQALHATEKAAETQVAKVRSRLPKLIKT